MPAPAMQQRPTGRLADESGSALTEFAIVAPLFILLIYWSQSFVDLSILKLKAEEAARYSVWEMTAHRPVAEVQQEINDRFRDLSSGQDTPADARGGVRPRGVRSFASVAITTEIWDNEPARMTGRLPPVPGGLGGFLTKIMEYAGRFLNRAVEWMLNTQFGLNQNGEARSQVTFAVENTLFPGGQVLGIFFDMGRPRALTVRAGGPPMVVDTWKAWPGKYNKFGSRSVNTDVYDTYPEVRGNGRGRAGAVESEVSKALTGGGGQSIAFMGYANSRFARIMNHASALGLPPLMSAKTWNDKSGPIAIWPADQPRHSFVPGYNQPNQRIGDLLDRSQYGSGSSYKPYFSADGWLGIDRSRYTVPYRVNTQLWNDRGGLTGLTNITRARNNDYVRMMNCRDVYYMGSRTAQLSVWAGTFNQRGFPGCP